MEDAFHPIEDKAPRIIRDIEVVGTGNKVFLTDEQRVTLSFFTAIQLSRVPNFRDGVEETYRKKAEKSLAETVSNDKQKGKLSPKAEELYKRGDIKIDIERFVSLVPMIDFASEVSTRLLEKVWHFAVPAYGIPFVTSDNPVYHHATEKYRERFGMYPGPQHPVSEVTIPLRKDLLLMFSPIINYTKGQYEQLNCTTVCLDKPSTIDLNKRTTLAAKRYVYSCKKSESLARMVGKFKGRSLRFTAG
jgi:hypothetical protein